MAKHACGVLLAIALVVGCSKAKDTGAGSATGSNAAAPTGSAAGSAPATGSASALASAAAAAAPPTGSATGSAAPTTGSAAAAPADTGYKVGDAVYGQWTDGDWYPGKIGKINDDSTYRVNYNDGDVSPSLSAKKVKPRKAGGGGGGGGAATASKGGAEPCPGTGWTRCGGNCYLLTDDPNHCGSCTNACPMNMSFCKYGKCDCSTVEKDNNGGVCPP